MIWIDMDGVVASFVPRVLEMHMGKTGVNVPYHTIVDPQISKVIPEWIEYMQSPGFFEGLDVEEGATELVDVLEKLHLGKWAFLTTVSTDVMDGAGQKMKWVESKFGLSWKHVVVAGRKDMVVRKEDLVVEDTPQMAIACMERGAKAILVDRPWNWSCSTAIPRMTLSQVTEYMRRGVKEHWSTP